MKTKKEVKMLECLAEIEIALDSIEPGERGWTEDALREAETLCSELRALLEVEP